MSNPLATVWNRLLRPESPPKRPLRYEIEPRLSCNEIILVRQAVLFLEKQGYLYPRQGRVDRIENRLYIIFPSNEDPKNSSEKIELF
jgi:hypothetical protein